MGKGSPARAQVHDKGRTYLQVNTGVLDGDVVEHLVDVHRGVVANLEEPVMRKGRV